MTGVRLFLGKLKRQPGRALWDLTLDYATYVGMWPVLHLAVGHAGPAVAAGSVQRSNRAAGAGGGRRPRSAWLGPDGPGFVSLLALPRFSSAIPSAALRPVAWSSRPLTAACSTCPRSRPTHAHGGQAWERRSRSLTLPWWVPANCPVCSLASTCSLVVPRESRAHRRQGHVRAGAAGGPRESVDGARPHAPHVHMPITDGGARLRRRERAQHHRLRGRLVGGHGANRRSLRAPGGLLREFW